MSNKNFRYYTHQEHNFDYVVMLLNRLGYNTALIDDTPADLIRSGVTLISNDGVNVRLYVSQPLPDRHDTQRNITRIDELMIELSSISDKVEMSRSAIRHAYNTKGCLTLSDINLLRIAVPELDEFIKNVLR